MTIGRRLPALEFLEFSIDPLTRDHNESTASGNSWKVGRSHRFYTKDVCWSPTPRTPSQISRAKAGCRELISRLRRYSIRLGRLVPSAPPPTYRWPSQTCLGYFAALDPGERIVYGFLKVSDVASTCIHAYISTYIYTYITWGLHTRILTCID